MLSAEPASPPPTAQQRPSEPFQNAPSRSKVNFRAIPIQEKLNSWNGVSLQHTARLHLLERWRERLLADEKACTEFMQEYPTADLQHLRTLIRNAHKEKLASKPPKSFRLLFHELQAIIPEAWIK